MFWSRVKKAAALASFACSMVFAANVNALTTADTRYLGNIDDGIPSNLSDEMAYINTLIAQPLGSGPTAVGSEQYTRSNNLCGGACPTAVLAGSTKNDNSNTTVNLGTGGFTYLLAKYDASQAGAYVWYVGGLTGNVTVPGNLGSCGSSGCGLSHTSLFNPGSTTVAEPGTLAAFALGLFGLALVRRRRTK